MVKDPLWSNGSSMVETQLLARRSSGHKSFLVEQRSFSDCKPFMVEQRRFSGCRPFISSTNILVSQKFCSLNFY